MSHEYAHNRQRFLRTDGGHVAPEHRDATRFKSDRRTSRLDKSCILTINGGSSSLKFALFAAVRPARRGYSPVRVERIGMPASRLVMVDADGAQAEDSTVQAPDQTAAVELLDRATRTTWLV